MKILLDTHVLLWAATKPERLSAAARELIEEEGILLLSPATYREMSIKLAIGKLEIPGGELEAFITEQIVELDSAHLPIILHHAAVAATLPLHHRDPFDRMLVAQATAENVPLLSADAAPDAYPVTRVWKSHPEATA